MLQKTRGIVLHHVRYGENSAIIYIFTEAFGRQSYLIQGIRKKKNTPSMSLLQPLSIHEMEVYHKEGRELQRIKEHRLNVIYQSIPYEIKKNTITLFLAELLYRTLREEESNPPLFSFLIHAFQFFDTSMEHTGNFHLWFMVQLTKHLGFYPDNNYSEKINRFDLIKGKFLQIPIDAKYTLSKTYSEILNRFLASRLSDISKISLKQENRTRIIETMLDYYAIHLEGMGKIKSLKVLREVFG
ncbi:MAG: DNA repair protein RecO [Bacteroidales bacterium]